MNIIRGSMIIFVLETQTLYHVRKLQLNHSGDNNGDLIVFRLDIYFQFKSFNTYVHLV